MKMTRYLAPVCLASACLAFALLAGEAGTAGRGPYSIVAPPSVSAQALNPSPPARVVKLIFIHHSTGENWLADENGDLGRALRDNNYFVSDTNYGWGPQSIGDTTDIGHWWNWFRGPNSASYLSALYAESEQHSEYSRLPANPGGENEIIMFKSCFPNSNLSGNPNDPPTSGNNPLRGQDSGSEHHTVANAKGIYNDLLAYFATRHDKLFVVIAAPPLVANETDAAHAANARAFNNWLVNEWLTNYPNNNVAVFDFYNVLTSNGGNRHTNDAGQETGNHHRWWNGAIQHIQTVNNNYAAYGSDAWDSHPTPAGNRKATAEFVPLLNVFYNRWKSTTPASPSLTLISPNGGEHWPMGSQQQIRWATTGSVPQVSLSYSTDGFLTTQVIASAITNTGSYTWTVPTTPTNSARVRVASADTPTAVYDDSDANFAIYDPSGEQTLSFQDGVAPDASYAGTTDVILANDANANANLGHLENLETFYGEAEHRRSLLRWDLSALPSNITVNAASVELYRYDGDAPNTMQIALYRVTRDWSEGTGYDFWPPSGYVPDGATWSTASPGVNWTTPGGDYDSTTDYGHGPNGILDQITLPAGMANGWIRLDATAAVRAWIEEGAPNQGLLLRPLSGQYTYHYYHSRNASTPNLRPRLVVTYTVRVNADATIWRF